MKNAKYELLQFLEECKLTADDIKAAKIVFNKISSHPDTKSSGLTVRLLVDPGSEQVKTFLDQLNEIEYSSGSQYISGTVWFKDGSWAKSLEYGHEEHWMLKTRPEIPEELCPYAGLGSSEQMLENLLCRIHRDGGHYIKRHGLEKAFRDADLKVSLLNAYYDETNGEKNE